MCRTQHLALSSPGVSQDWAGHKSDPGDFHSTKPTGWTWSSGRNTIYAMASSRTPHPMVMTAMPSKARHAECLSKKNQFLEKASNTFLLKNSAPKTETCHSCLQTPPECGLGSFFHFRQLYQRTLESILIRQKSVCVGGSRSLWYKAGKKI